MYLLYAVSRSFINNTKGKSNTGSTESAHQIRGPSVPLEATKSLTLDLVIR